MHQQETVEGATRAEAEALASQCLEHSKRSAALLADQQDMKEVFERARDAVQAQVCLKCCRNN